MRKENQGIRDAGQIGQAPGFFVFRFSLSRVGRKSIRPTNDPKGAGTRRWEGPDFYRPTHITWREEALPPNPYVLFLS